MQRRDFLKSTSAIALAGVFGLTASDALAQERKPPNGRILLKNGIVLSFDRAVGDFDRADVLIDGRRIAAVRPNIQAEATTINASNMIVMPGFIDTHHHFYQSALRNVLANGLLSDYFRDIVNVATPLYRVEDAYAGVLAGAIRSVDAGVTTVTDLSQVSNSPQHSDAMIRAFKESGIRAIYAYTRGYGPAAKFPQDVERIQKQHFPSNDQLVSLAMSTGIDKDQWEIARRSKLRVFMHVVGGVPNVGPDAVEKLGQAGLMGPDLVYIHFTGAKPEQVKMIKDTGGWLSIACPIEMTMRHGLPPLQMALDAGIRPSLSSDVETTMASDMFTQLRSVFTLQRALINDRAIKGEKELPPLLTARDVLAMATIEGARADGLESKTGSLTPGKDADIIMLRTDLPNVLPLNNAYGAVVTGMDTSNVDTVFVAGKMLKQKGRLVGVNLDRLRKLTRESRDYLVAKAGWPRSVTDTSLSVH